MFEKSSFILVNTEQQERIDQIRDCFQDLYDSIDELCKDSRERSLAITKLEEAQFWAIKGISREGVNNGTKRHN